MLHNQKYHPNLESVPVDRRRPLAEQLALNLTPWNFAAMETEIGRYRIGQVEISGNGGGFCCEHLAYEVLVGQLSQKIATRLPFAFIHIPCCRSAIKDLTAFLRQGKILVSIDEVIQGLEILLRNSKLPR